MCASCHDVCASCCASCISTVPHVPLKLRPRHFTALACLSPRSGFVAETYNELLHPQCCMINIVAIICRWKRRLSHLAQYFSAYRIDHILGFCRIWEIPGDCGTGGVD